MPLLVTSVPNLAQGVSQQPDNLRYPGQCDEQINAWATVVEGLVKRPNTEYIKNIQKTGDKSDLFTHFVKRSENTKYCVNVSLGGVGVINLADGTNVSVAVTSIASTYLSLGTAASLGGVANPLADLKALTVADYTFLVNKNKLVQKSTASELKSDTPGDKALVFVKLGDYSKHYTVIIDDEVVPHVNTGTLNYHKTPQLGATEATYESGDAGGTGQAWHADTEIIADDLAKILSASTANTDGLDSVSVNGTFTHTHTFFNGLSTSSNVYTKIVRTNSPQYRQGQKNIPPHSQAVAAGMNKIVYQYKLIAEFTQPGASGGRATAIVKNGHITGFTNFTKGKGYVSGTALGITWKVQSRKAEEWYWDTKWKQSWNGWSTPYLIPSHLGGTPPAAYTTSTNDAATDAILFTAVNTAQPYEITRKGSVIQLESTIGPFNIRVEDGLSNQGLGVVYKEVNSITDLPAQCFNAFGPVKVIGDADINQDDYYVRFSTKDNQEFGEGSWVETVGFSNDSSLTGSDNGLDTRVVTSTMPVVLLPYFDSKKQPTAFRLSNPGDVLYVRNNGVYYSLTQDHRAIPSREPGSGADWEDFWLEVDETEDIGAAVGYLKWKNDTLYYGGTSSGGTRGWTSRQAGDDVTNPFPSFVNNRIRDIFFFKNRLGLLTDSNVIFSEADEYYNFFRTTTQQLLDSAPIDVGLSHTKVAVLQHAIPFQEKLILFSKQSQFVLRGADVLSPQTVAISPVTEYDISDNVDPVAVGSFIYFPFKREQFEGMYEYFVDNNTEVFEATEITSQVPKYIPSGVTHLVGSNSENLIVCKSSEEPKSLYVYKYFWQNKEKIQSAWMKFTYNRDIRGFDFIDSDLYVLTEDSNALHLEKATMESGLTDTGLDYRLLLDSRVDGKDVTVSLYNPATKVTRVTDIPFNVSIASPSAEIYTKIGTQRATTVVDSSTIDISGAVGSYVDDGLGDYVTYNGSTYYCKTAHTSTSTFELKYWTEVSSVPSYGSSSEWTASTAYSKGTIYKCVHSDDTIQAHTSTAATRPGSGGDSVNYWQTSTDFSSATLWEAGRLYNDDTYFFIGIPYDMLYRFSNQILKQPTERGGRSASDYTFQTIRNASVEYADTGHFIVEVTPKYRDTYAYAFNPDIVGANLTLNVFEPQTGHFRFPVQCQPNDATIEVKSSSALPVKLLAAEFESLVSARSKRYGG